MLTVHGCLCFVRLTMPSLWSFWEIVENNKDNMQYARQKKTAGFRSPYVKNKDFFLLPVERRTLAEDNKIISPTSMAAAGGSKGKRMLCKKKKIHFSACGCNVAAE